MVIIISTKKIMAFDAIEIGALDFLLEPVHFERFFRAAEKPIK
jgi:hypothetical protein